MIGKRAGDVVIEDGLDLGQHPDSLGDNWKHIYAKRGLIILAPKHLINVFFDEHIMKDEHSNYVYYANSMLTDGNTYDWRDWIKPSICDILGGGLVTDEVLAHYRNEAANAFATSEGRLNSNDRIVINEDNRGKDKGQEEATA